MSLTLEQWKARRDAAERARQVPDVEAVVASLQATFAQAKVMTQDEERAHILQAEIFPRLRAMGWGDRFLRELSGEWGCAEQRKKFDRCRELCRGVGAVVALVGPRGVGKTTIAFQLALERAWQDRQSLFDKAAGLREATTWRTTPYRKLTDLLARYKALYADFGTMDPVALAESRDRLCSEESLAVFDEIHECEGLKAAPRLLTDIIDRRYLAKKDTLLITNQTAQEFSDTIGDSIYSRLTEHGAILKCEWPSWREKSLTTKDTKNTNP